MESPKEKAAPSRFALRELLRDALRAAVRREHAALDFRDREGGVLGGDAQVGREQQRPLPPPRQ
jgi:hypothetical protein